MSERNSRGRERCNWIESLEGKTLLAFSPAVDGEITYTASGGADTIDIVYYGGSLEVGVTENGVEARVSAVGLNRVIVDGAGGDDEINTGSYGNDFPMTLSILGGTGMDNIIARTPVIQSEQAALRIDGGADADDIAFTTAGYAYVAGAGGNDTIVFGGDDSLTEVRYTNIEGGDGDDRISAGSFAVIYGDAGNDTIHGSYEGDIFYTGGYLSASGGPYNPPTVSKGFDDDLVYGGSGHDDFFVASGNDSCYGEAGNDFMILQCGDQAQGRYFDGLITLDGGDDNDLFLAGDNLEPALLIGGNGDDDIEVTAHYMLNQPNTVLGGEGNDQLSTYFADVLDGQAGDDILNPYLTPDYKPTVSMTLKGGSGNDSIIGGNGNDVIDGGTGRDSVIANGGDDTITASLAGGSIHGNGGNDTITAFAGPVISGVVYPGARLFGDSGNDVITGTPGNDTLDGGSGSDMLIGAKGNDRYTFANASAQENDVVSEQPGGGTDTLDFAALTTSVTGRLNSVNIASMRFRTVTVVGRENSNFENLIGGHANDILTGNGSTNLLIGNDGDDQFFAVGDSGKKDTLNGGGGTDVVKSKDSDDILLSIP